MRLAYFPKDPAEASIFAREFRRQQIEAQVLLPSDIFLEARQSVATGVAPGLTLRDLEDPHCPLKAPNDFEIVFQRSVWSWNPKYGPEIVQFFFEALCFMQDAIPVVNAPEATLNASRKHICLSMLSRRGLPIVPFFASPNPIRTMLATHELPPPSVVKTLQGGGGIGVVVAPTDAVVGDLISLFHRNRQVPLLQPYYQLTHDIRVFVLAGQVLGAIRREGAIHKHNISLGAKPRKIPPTTLPADLQEIAIRSAETLGLDIAGVDFLPTDDGPRVLEVNPSPGFSGFQKAAGLNVPRHIIHHLLSRARK